MKKLLTLVTVIAALSTMASQARIDVSGASKGINLKPGSKSKGCAISNPGWIKDENKKKKYIYFASPRLKDKWEEVELSFTPDKDGIVYFKIGGQWYNTKKGQKPTYVYVKEVQITEGSKLVNGDFSKKNKKGDIAGWNYNKKAKELPEVEEVDGETIVKLQFVSGVGQSIPVKKGVPVKVKATVKKAAAK